jgi:hypothetical protein
MYGVGTPLQISHRHNPRVYEDRSENQVTLRVISGFRLEVYEICALMGNYAAYSGNSLLAFRGNLSSRVKGYCETPVKNYLSTLRNFPQERRSHFAVLLFWVFSSTLIRTFHI